MAHSHRTHTSMLVLCLLTLGMQTWAVGISTDMRSSRVHDSCSLASYTHVQPPRTAPSRAIASRTTPAPVLITQSAVITAHNTSTCIDDPYATSCDPELCFDLAAYVPEVTTILWTCFTTFIATETAGTIIYIVNSRLNSTSTITKYASGISSFAIATTTTGTMTFSAQATTASAVDVTLVYPTSYIAWPVCYEWSGQWPCLVSSQTESCEVRYGGCAPFTALPTAIPQSRSFPQDGDAIGSDCYLWHTVGLWKGPLPPPCEVAPMPFLYNTSTGTLPITALYATTFATIMSTHFVDDGGSSTMKARSSDATSMMSSAISTSTYEDLGSAESRSTTQLTVSTIRPVHSLPATQPAPGHAIADSDLATATPGTQSFAADALVPAILLGLVPSTLAIPTTIPSGSTSAGDAGPSLFTTQPSPSSNQLATSAPLGIWNPVALLSPAVNLLPKC